MKITNEAIDKVLDDFDFHKVRLAMRELNWEWRDKGVPTVKMLRDTAIRLLMNLRDDDSISASSTGGLIAYIDNDGYGEGGKVLRLEFVLESASVYEYQL